MDLRKQEIMGWLSAGPFALCSKQINIPLLHRSNFFQAGCFSSGQLSKSTVRQKVIVYKRHCVACARPSAGLNHSHKPSGM